jgi:Protein of unknown function (DUF4235)
VRERVVKLAYRPFGMLISVLGGLAAGAIFRRLWRILRNEETAPTATDPDRGWGEIALAAALEGALFGVVRAVIDRAGATGFARATGTWPD